MRGLNERVALPRRRVDPPSLHCDVRMNVAGFAGFSGRGSPIKLGNAFSNLVGKRGCLAFQLKSTCVQVFSTRPAALSNPWNCGRFQSSVTCESAERGDSCSQPGLDCRPFLGADGEQHGVADAAVGALLVAA